MTDTFTVRFWSKVDRSGDPDACWEWQAARNRDGYGSFRVSDHIELAHRVAWMLDTGEPVPEGMDVLHRCDNPPCVRRSHLWLGTAADNAQDSVAKGRHVQARKTYCDHEHEFDAANTIIDSRTGKRACRSCRDTRTRRWNADHPERVRESARTSIARRRASCSSM